jgi:uncharacterized protein (TIGR02996 family)
MTTRRALLQAVLDAPDDDLPRLVFADWLDDHDESDRADFIRAQIELSRTPEDSPRFEQLRRQTNTQPRTMRQDRWLKEVPGWARHRAEFRRGFVEHVVCTAASFARRGARLFDNAPVRSVTLTAFSNQVGLVATVPYTSRLRALTLNAERYEERLTPAEIQQLAASPHVANLEMLNLVGNWLGGPETERLTASTGFPSLHTLELGHNYLGHNGVEQLLAWPELKHVRKLALNANALGSMEQRPGVLFVRSPNFQSLEVLNLRANFLHPEDFVSLAKTPAFTRLVVLDLSGCHFDRLDDAGCAALAASPYLTSLQHLSLRENAITANGVRALLASTSLPARCRIDLRSCQLDDAEKGELRPPLAERFGPNVLL